MRALALLCPLLLVIACGGSESTPPPIKADGIVVVNASGIVRWNGERVRLTELASALNKLEGDAHIVLDAEGDTCWGHVQWALALLKKNIWKPAGFRMDGGDTVLPRNNSRFSGDWPMSPGGILLLQIEWGDRGVVTYTMGMRSSPSLRVARSWIAEAIPLLGVAGLFTVEADTRVPYRAIHPLLRELFSHEHVITEIGTETPHPWVMRQDPLPIPGWNEIVRRWDYDLTGKDLAPLTLPLAVSAQADKDDDPDDRVILNLVASAQLIQCGRSINLTELTELLRDAKRRYSIERERIGKSGEEDGGPSGWWTKLFVLLRTDHEIPWRDVRDVLDLLRHEKFYKLQFAVSRSATLDHSPEEADLVGVDRLEIAPSTFRTLDAKIQCFLATERMPAYERHIDVEITDRGRFRIGEVETLDLGLVRELIRKRLLSPESRSGRFRVLGRVTAQPATPFRLVVAAVDSFRRSGMEKVNLR